MIKNIKMLFLVSLTFVACNTNDDVEVVQNSSDGLPLTAGTANFSNYVALGNSLTAGYSDNALFIEGQKSSYSNILAQQFALVGGGAFKIPYMADNVGGFSGSTEAGPRLYFNGTGLSPVSGTSTTQISTPATGGPFNNCGVPGAKSFHLLSPSYGNFAGLLTNPQTANPYYVRFAPNGSTSVLSYAMSQSPTFFSLWIGNNDVLGYATTGGDGSNPITPVSGAAGVGFDGTYDALVNTLTSAGAKGVVANIPYVTSIPFFTAVPYNAIPVDAANATLLNSLTNYGAYNQGLVGAKNAGLITETERLQRTINFVAGKNAPVIIDEYLTTVNVPGVLTLPNYRQATATDYIVLSSGGVSAQAHFFAGGGTAIALTDKWVLSKNEVAEVKAATDSYNAKINAVATSKGLAFVDANAVMSKVANGGVSANGYNVTNEFLFGGGFSTDGVHPSPRGYALLANKFMEAINTTYGSNLKAVNLADYRILFPGML